MIQKRSILENLYKDQLISICRKFEISNYSGKNSDDVVTLIMKKRAVKVNDILSFLKVDELRTLCSLLELSPIPSKKDELISFISFGEVQEKPDKRSKYKDENQADHTNGKPSQLDLNVTDIGFRYQGKKLEAIPSKLLEIKDGDTIKVLVDQQYGIGEHVYVRFRGIDAPESYINSDKFEKELDRTSLTSAQMIKLGKLATKKLKDIIKDTSIIYLQCEPTPNKPKPYLHHRQYRLLAFITLDDPNGEDIGEYLIREGFALVWPRNLDTKRYIHPKSDRYVWACNYAMNDNLGLWKEGLSELCPLKNSKNKKNIGIETCLKECQPALLR